MGVSSPSQEETSRAGVGSLHELSLDTVGLGTCSSPPAPRETALPRTHSQSGPPGDQARNESKAVPTQRRGGRCSSRSGGPGTTQGATSPAVQGVDLRVIGRGSAVRQVSGSAQSTQWSCAPLTRLLNRSLCLAPTGHHLPALPVLGSLSCPSLLVSSGLSLN